MHDPSAALKRCAQVLKSARAVAVSTGAGISKESGIPTFRDAPNALWAKYDPDKLATREGFRSDPALVWRWYDERRQMIAKAAPNPGHRAIADLENRFERFALITQNIDDLHRKAGSQNVIELHGNIFRYKCFDRDHPVDSLPDDDRVPPRCHCGSYLRPNVVWFGELLPEDEMERAYAALEAADVALVVGTSGLVYPAAGLSAVAKAAGAVVVEINPEATPLTRDMDLFLRGAAGEILPELLALMDRRVG